MARREEEFYIFCERNNLQEVKRLASQVDINWRNPNQKLQTGLFVACEKGNKDVVEFLLTLPNLDANIPHEAGRSPIWIACCGGHEKIVKMLLQDVRVDPNQPNKNGGTPLFVSCDGRKEEIVKMLFACGRLIDTTRKGNLNGNWITAGEIAQRRGYQSIVQLVNEYAINPSKVASKLRKQLNIEDTSLEKYLGIELPWHCKSNPLDFGEDPLAVKELLLVDCGAQHFIDKLERFVYVEKLDLSSNKLESLPDFIDNFPLQMISIHHNKFKSLPYWFERFSFFEKLDLSCNELETLPEFIGNFKNLKLLDLSQNQLQELPEEIGALSQLESLNISKNSLTQISLQLIKNNIPNFDFSDNPLSNECQLEILEYLSQKSEKKELWNIFRGPNIEIPTEFLREIFPPEYSSFDQVANLLLKMASNPVEVFPTSHMPLVEYLLNIRGDGFNIPNSENETPLSLSCNDSTIEVFKFLCMNQANPDYLNLVENQVGSKYLEVASTIILSKLSQKDGDKWNEVEVCNWLLIKLDLDAKIARQFKENHVNGATLMSFRDEYDLDSICPQPKFRTLIFTEKENLRMRLEAKRGEQEEQLRHYNDVFVSYCWANAELVRATATNLAAVEIHDSEGTRRKLEVWIDIEKMKGDIYNSMENGVRNCKVFLSFISPQYAASANCQRELKLGNDLKKKIICCLVDPASRFENKGWPPPGIGTLVAGNLYIDLTKDYEQNFSQVLSQTLGSMGASPTGTTPKLEAVPAPAPTATATATPAPTATPGRTPAPAPAPAPASTPASAQTLTPKKPEAKVLPKIAPKPSLSSGKLQASGSQAEPAKESSSNEVVSLLAMILTKMQGLEGRMAGLENRMERLESMVHDGFQGLQEKLGN